MNPVLKTTLALTLLASDSPGANSVAGEADLLEPVRPYVRQVIREFGQIDAERAATLKQAAGFIRQRLEQGKPAQLTFICTHNSRRSHLAQVWSQTAAVYYG